MKLTIRPDDPKGRDTSLESYGEDILNDTGSLPRRQAGFTSFRMTDNSSHSEGEERPKNPANDTGSLPRRQAGFTNAQDDKLFGKQTITFYNPILLAGPESAATPPRKPLTIDQIFTNIARRILDKDDPDDPQVVALKRVFIYSLQDIQDGFNPSRRVRGTTPTVREMGGAFDRNYATAASKISLATEDLQRFRDRFMAFVLGRAVELGLVGTATVSQKSKATSLTIYPSTADVAIRLRRAYLLIRGAEENLNRLKSIHVIPAKAGIQQSPKRLDPRWSLPSAKAGGGDDNGVRGDDNGVRGDDNGVRRDDTRYDSMLAQLEKYKAALEKLGSGGDEETYNSDVVRRKLGGNDLLTERALKIAQGIEDISRDSIIMKRVELFDFKDPFIAKFVKDIKPNLKAYVDKYISGKGSDPGGDYDFYFRVAEVFAAYWVHENRSNVPSHITSSVDARDMAVYHVVSHMGMAPKEAKELVLKAHNFIYSLIRQDSWSSRTADIAGFPSTEKIRGITALPVVASQTYPVGRFVQYDLTGMRDYVDNMGLLIDDDFHDRFYTEVGVKFNTFLGWGGLTTPSISRFSWKILVDKILSPDELKVFIQNNPPAENEIRKVIGNFETEGGGDVNGTWKRYVDGVANTGWLKSFALNKYPRPDKMPRDLWLRYVEYARSIGRLEYVSVEPVSTRSLEAVTKAFDFLAVELEKYNKFIDPLEYIAAISPVMRRVVAKSRESFGVAYIEKLGIVDDVDFANLSFKAFADALKKGGHADRIAHLETIIDFHAHGGSRMPLNANLEEYANSLSDLCMGDRQKIENLYTFLAGFLKWVFFIEGYVEVYNISGQNVSFASNRFREHSTVQLRADPADYKSGQVTGVTNEEQMIIINIYRDVYSRLLEKVRGYLDAVDSVANLLSAKVDFSAVSENGFNRDGFETTYGEMLDKNRIYQEGLQQREKRAARLSPELRSELHQFYTGLNKYAQEVLIFTRARGEVVTEMGTIAFDVVPRLRGQDYDTNQSGRVVLFADDVLSYAKKDKWDDDRIKSQLILRLLIGRAVHSDIIAEGELDPKVIKDNITPRWTSDLVALHLAVDDYVKIERDILGIPLEEDLTNVIATYGGVGGKRIFKPIIPDRRYTPTVEAQFAAFAGGSSLDADLIDVGVDSLVRYLNTINISQVFWPRRLTKIINNELKVITDASQDDFENVYSAIVDFLPKIGVANGTSIVDAERAIDEANLASQIAQWAVEDYAAFFTIDSANEYFSGEYALPWDKDHRELMREIVMQYADELQQYNINPSEIMMRAKKLIDQYNTGKKDYDTSIKHEKFEKPLDGLLEGRIGRFVGTFERRRAQSLDRALVARVYSNLISTVDSGQELSPDEIGIELMTVSKGISDEDIELYTQIISEFILYQDETDGVWNKMVGGSQLGIVSFVRRKFVARFISDEKLLRMIRDYGSQRFKFQRSLDVAVLSSSVVDGEFLPYRSINEKMENYYRLLLNQYLFHLGRSADEIKARLEDLKTAFELMTEESGDKLPYIYDEFVAYVFNYYSDTISIRSMDEARSVERQYLLIHEVLNGSDIGEDNGSYLSIEDAAKRAFMKAHGLEFKRVADDEAARIAAQKADAEDRLETLEIARAEWDDNVRLIADFREQVEVAYVSIYNDDEIEPTSLQEVRDLLAELSTQRSELGTLEDNFRVANSRLAIMSGLTAILANVIPADSIVIPVPSNVIPATSIVIPATSNVIPAKAGIQRSSTGLDPRLRGDDNGYVVPNLDNEEQVLIELRDNLDQRKTTLEEFRQQFRVEEIASDISDIADQLRDRSFEGRAIAVRLNDLLSRAVEFSSERFPKAAESLDEFRSMQRELVELLAEMEAFSAELSTRGDDLDDFLDKRFSMLEHVDKASDLAEMAAIEALDAGEDTPEFGVIMDEVARLEASIGILQNSVRGASAVAVNVGDLQRELANEVVVVEGKLPHATNARVPGAKTMIQGKSVDLKNKVWIINPNESSVDYRVLATRRVQYILDAQVLSIGEDAYLVTSDDVSIVELWRANSAREQSIKLKDIFGQGVVIDSGTYGVRVGDTSTLDKMHPFRKLQTALTNAVSQNGQHAHMLAMLFEPAANDRRGPLMVDFLANIAGGNYFLETPELAIDFIGRWALTNMREMTHKRAFGKASNDWFVTTDNVPVAEAKEEAPVETSTEKPAEEPKIYSDEYSLEQQAANAEHLAQTIEMLHFGTIEVGQETYWVDRDRAEKDIAAKNSFHGYKEEGTRVSGRPTLVDFNRGKYARKRPLIHDVFSDNPNSLRLQNVYYEVFNDPDLDELGYLVTRRESGDLPGPLREFILGALEAYVMGAKEVEGHGLEDIQKIAVGFYKSYLEDPLGFEYPEIKKGQMPKLELWLRAQLLSSGYEGDEKRFAVYFKLMDTDDNFRRFMTMSSLLARVFDEVGLGAEFDDHREFLLLVKGLYDDPNGVIDQKLFKQKNEAVKKLYLKYRPELLKHRHILRDITASATSDSEPVVAQHDVDAAERFPELAYVSPIEVALTAAALVSNRNTGESAEIELVLYTLMKQYPELSGMLALVGYGIRDKGEGNDLLRAELERIGRLFASDPDFTMEVYDRCRNELLDLYLRIRPTLIQNFGERELKSIFGITNPWNIKIEKYHMKDGVAGSRLSWANFTLEEKLHMMSPEIFRIKKDVVDHSIDGLYRINFKGDQLIVDGQIYPTKDFYRKMILGHQEFAAKHPELRAVVMIDRSLPWPDGDSVIDIYARYSELDKDDSDYVQKEHALYIEFMQAHTSIEYARLVRSYMGWQLKHIGKGRFTLTGRGIERFDSDRIMMMSKSFAALKPDPEKIHSVAEILTGTKTPWLPEVRVAASVEKSVDLADFEDAEFSVEDQARLAQEASENLLNFDFIGADATTMPFDYNRIRWLYRIHSDSSLKDFSEHLSQYNEEQRKGVVFGDAANFYAHVLFDELSRTTRNLDDAQILFEMQDILEKIADTELKDSFDIGVGVDRSRFRMPELHIMSGMSHVKDAFGDIMYAGYDKKYPNGFELLETAAESSQNLRKVLIAHRLVNGYYGGEGDRKEGAAWRSRDPLGKLLEGLEVGNQDSRFIREYADIVLREYEKIRADLLSDRALFNTLAAFDYSHHSPLTVTVDKDLVSRFPELAKITQLYRAQTYFGLEAKKGLNQYEDLIHNYMYIYPELMGLFTVLISIDQNSDIVTENMKENLARLLWAKKEGQSVEERREAVRGELLKIYESIRPQVMEYLKTGEIVYFGKKITMAEVMTGLEDPWKRNQDLLVLDDAAIKDKISFYLPALDHPNDEFLSFMNSRLKGILSGQRRVGPRHKKAVNGAMRLMEAYPQLKHIVLFDCAIGVWPEELGITDFFVNFEDEMSSIDPKREKTIILKYYNIFSEIHSLPEYLSVVRKIFNWKIAKADQVANQNTLQFIMPKAIPVDGESLLAFMRLLVDEFRGKPGDEVGYVLTGDREWWLPKFDLAQAQATEPRAEIMQPVRVIDRDTMLPLSDLGRVGKMSKDEIFERLYSIEGVLPDGDELNGMIEEKMRGNKRISRERAKLEIFAKDLDPNKEMGFVAYFAKKSERVKKGFRTNVTVTARVIYSFLLENREEVFKLLVKNHGYVENEPFPTDPDDDEPNGSGGTNGAPDGGSAPVSNSGGFNQLMAPLNSLIEGFTSVQSSLVDFYMRAAEMGDRTTDLHPASWQGGLGGARMVGFVNLDALADLTDYMYGDNGDNGDNGLNPDPSAQTFLKKGSPFLGRFGEQPGVNGVQSPTIMPSTMLFLGR